MSRYSIACLVLLAILSGALHFALLDTARVPPVFPDSIHQLSLADNVLHHQGLSTSILHYPDHYQFGTIPAPQTVWPPGIGLGTALLSAAGMTPLNALTTITFVAAFLLPLVAFLGVRASSRSVAAAFVCAILVLSVPANWAYTQRLMSESAFALLTLASLVTLTASVGRDYRLRLAAAAGVLAGLAFLVRYAGIFYIAASGFVLLCAVALNPNRRALRALAVYAVTSGLPVIALFARNFLLRDQLSGGQFIDAEPLGIARAGLYFFWTCRGLLSRWFGEWVPQWLLNVVLIAAMLGLAWIYCVAIYRFVRDARSSQHPAVIAVLIAVTYALITAGVHTVSAALYAGWFLSEPRYFVVLLPLIFFAVTLYLADRFPALEEPDGRWTERRSAIVACATAIFAVHAGLRWDEAAPDWGHRQRHTNFGDALSLPFEGSQRTIGEFLRANLPDDRAVLTPYPESLYLAIGRPAVGLIGRRLADVAWTRETVTALLCKLPIDYVLTTRPGLIEAEGADGDVLGRIFDGEPAGYLRAINHREDVKLYAVDRAALSAGNSGRACRQ